MSDFFLSSIKRRFRLETGSPKRTLQIKRIDFTLDALNVDYPRVKQFLFQIVGSSDPHFQQGQARGRNHALSALEWDRIDEIDWKQALIRVHKLRSIPTIDREALVREVLLERDILDAVIIDLQNRRARRANDLLLEYDKVLRLRAADTGSRALLRRISRGIYRGSNQDELQDWKYVEFLRGEPEAVHAGAVYHRRITRLPSGEITNLVEGLPYLHAAELILLLPDQLAADVLELMTAERQLQVFEELDEPYALKLLEKMSPDVAADVIGRLVPELARRYLERLPKSASQSIVDLLRYPEDTVGGIMTNDVIALPADLTVAEAREKLRKELKKPDFVYFLYIVDDYKSMHLQGVVTLRGILLAQDDQRLGEIMNPYLETLSPLDSPMQSAYRLINSQLAALPVIGEDGQLLGAVTVDAAISQVAPANWRYQAPRVFS